MPTESSTGSKLTREQLISNLRETRKEILFEMKRILEGMRYLGKTDEMEHELRVLGAYSAYFKNVIAILIRGR